MFIVELNGVILRCFKRECNAKKQAYKTIQQRWFNLNEDIVNVISTSTGEIIFTSDK